MRNHDVKGIKGKVFGAMYFGWAVVAGIFGANAANIAKGCNCGIGLQMISVAVLLGAAVAFQIVLSTGMLLILWFSPPLKAESDKGGFFCFSILGWIAQIFWALLLLQYTGEPYELPALYPSLVAISTPFVIIFGIFALYFTVMGKSPEEGKQEK